MPAGSEAFWFKTDQFLQAIAEYAGELHKDFAYSVNRQMLNASIKATQNAPVADKGMIERLRTPQMAAYWLSKHPLRHERVKYRHLTGKIGKNWNKKYRTYYRWVNRHYSRQEAKKYLRSVIGRRKAAVTFVKSFYANFQTAIRAKCPDLKGGSVGRTKSGFTFGYRQATPEDPSAYGTVQYEYRKSRTSKVALDRKLEKTWMLGMDLAIADMRQYLADQLAKRAAAHSVK